MSETVTLNSYKFPDIYSDFDVTVGDLGCVMLNTQKLYFAEIDNDDLYYSPTQRYAQGQVSKDSAHVTLKYGFMPGVKRSHVDAVLEGWEVDKVLVDHIGVFPSPGDGEEYNCVVAKLNLEHNPLILEAHQRLSFLPHIDSFMEFSPHITLAYTKVGTATDRILTIVKNSLTGASLETFELNYGDEIK